MTPGVSPGQVPAGAHPPLSPPTSQGPAGKGRELWCRHSPADSLRGEASSLGAEAPAASGAAHSLGRELPLGRELARGGAVALLLSQRLHTDMRALTTNIHARLTVETGTYAPCKDRAPQRCSWPAPAHRCTNPQRGNRWAAACCQQTCVPSMRCGRPSAGHQPGPDLTERAVGATITFGSVLMVDMNAEYEERRQSAAPQQQPAADGQERSTSAPCSTPTQPELAGQKG